MLSSRRPPLSAALVLCLAPVFAPAATYCRPRGEWEPHRPALAGMDSARLQQAIDFSIAHENPHTKDLAVELKETFGAQEPRWKLLGPTQPRGGMTGLIIRHGYVVAQWGEPDRVDMTHSGTKTFLTTLTALPWHRALIPHIAAPPQDCPPLPSLFPGSHHHAPPRR